MVRRCHLKLGNVSTRRWKGGKVNSREKRQEKAKRNKKAKRKRKRIEEGEDIEVGYMLRWQAGRDEINGTEFRTSALWTAQILEHEHKNSSAD